MTSDDRFLHPLAEQIQELVAQLSEVAERENARGGAVRAQLEMLTQERDAERVAKETAQAAREIETRNRRRAERDRDVEAQNALSSIKRIKELEAEVARLKAELEAKPAASSLPPELQPVVEGARKIMDALFDDRFRD